MVRDPVGEMGRAQNGRRATLGDVAAAAGVSVGTASVVFNNHPTARVAKGTRARVRAAIEDLDFRPNLTARQLRTQQTHTIGVITDEIASTPFAGRILLGAHEVAWHRGRLLLLVNTNGDADVERTSVQMLIDRRVDGLMYAAQSAHEITLQPEMRTLPTVLVNAFTRNTGETPHVIPSVLADEMHGGSLAVQRVIDAGHRNIVYLAGDRRLWATKERLKGVRDRLSAAGLPADRTRVIHGTYNIDSGYERALAVLARPDRPTALVCGNDRIALGALLAAHARGLAVPSDLSLVGYDDQEELAERLTPPLTTVSLPHFEMGRAGLQTLLDLFDGKAVTPAVSVRGELIERGSVAAPPSA